MVDKFTRNDGSPSLYALACGYLHAHTVDGNRQGITLSLDGCYHVKALLPDRRVRECFKYRRDAERFMRTLVREARARGLLNVGAGARPAQRGGGCAKRWCAACSTWGRVREMITKKRASFLS